MYLRSTDGNDTDNGSTWVLAKATLAAAATAAGAGGTIHFSQGHAESNSGGATVTFPGTVINPNTVICSNDAAEPPTSVATSGSLSTTGSGHLIIAGSASIYGMTINVGSPAQNYAIIRLNYSASVNAVQIYEDCSINLIDTHPSSEIRVGSDGGLVTDTQFFNTTFKLPNVNNYFRLYGKVRMVGGGFSAGSLTPSAGLFTMHGSGVPTELSIEDFDFSQLASSLIMFAAPTSGQPANAKVRNCKLPAGWSGSLVAAPFSTPNCRFEMWNCDSGDSNYKLWIEDAAGSVRSETVIVATGGATDGVTASSLKMSSNSNATLAGLQLVSPDMCAKVTSVGSPKTVTVEIVHDSATPLTDKEIWLEVEYLGNAASTLGKWKTDRSATRLTVALDQTASAAGWTTTGLSTPNKQSLSVTFTPQKIGLLQCRVVLAKASKTVYVDQKPTVA